MATQVLGTHDRTATLNFWRTDGSVPEPLNINGDDVTLDRPLIPHSVTLHDITGTESSFQLDTHAFTFRHFPSLVDKPALFSSGAKNDRIKLEYYPECEKLLTTLIPTAVRAHVFDHRVRTSEGEHKTGPVARVHVDHSDKGSRAFLKFYMGHEESERILRGGRRWQIINVWRPLKTIQRDPLTLGDGKTFSEDDFVGAVVHYPTYDGESMAVKRNPEPGRQKFYYKYQMSPDEVVLIKNFDSDKSVPACRCPHSGVVDTDPEALARESRESVEVRAFVFY